MSDFAPDDLYPLAAVEFAELENRPDLCGVILTTERKIHRLVLNRKALEWLGQEFLKEAEKMPFTT